LRERKRKGRLIIKMIQECDRCEKKILLIDLRDAPKRKNKTIKCPYCKNPIILNLEKKK